MKAQILQTVEFQPKTSVHIQHGGKQPAIAFHTSLSQLYQTKKHHVGNFGMYPKKRNYIYGLTFRPWLPIYMGEREQP